MDGCYIGDVCQFKDFAVSDGERFKMSKGKHVLRTWFTIGRTTGWRRVMTR